MKKINDERNHLEESLEAANEKIGAFIQQITHNEELMAVMNREQTKLRTRLAKAERVNDQLETKKESDSKLLETEKLKSRDIERSLNKMIETEKIWREQWVERYETEHKSHLETTAEVMQLRTKVKELTNKSNSLKIERDLLKKDNDKIMKKFDDKRESLQITLSQLGMID